MLQRTVILLSIFLAFGLNPAIAQARKVYTIQEILDARIEEKKAPTAKYCSGGVFKPCICAPRVTKLVQYRPAVKECNNRAAIIVSGKYLNAYSLVVRDKLNKDRWPVHGTNGCTPHETNDLGLNKCSVFKVQKVVPVENETDLGDAEVHCLGASGYSTLFRDVRRITIKLQDVPDSNADPLVRLCLVGPTKELN